MILGLNLIRKQRPQRLLTNVFEQAEPHMLKRSVYKQIYEHLHQNRAPPTLDAGLFWSSPFWIQLLSYAARSRPSLKHSSSVSHKRHNALIHDSWKGFDTVYKMLPVHPESCQSKERRVRAAKSQEVGSRAKNTMLMCNKTKTWCSDFDRKCEQECLRLESEDLQVFTLFC